MLGQCVVFGWCAHIVLISYVPLHIYPFTNPYCSGGSGNPKENKPKAFTDKAKVEVKRLQQIAKSISALL